MTALKTKHKVGLGVTVAIISIILILGITGAFVAYNHYHVGTGSSDGPTSDNSQTSDSVSIHKTGFIPSVDADLSTVVALAKENGVYTHYADQQTNVISSTIDPWSHHFTGVTTSVYKHADGVVFAVVESENTRTVEGINCAQQILFATNTGLPLNTNGSAVCQGLDVRSPTGWNGFNVIILGNRTTTTANTLNGSDTVTTSKIGGSRASAADGLILTATANEGGPQRGTVAGTSTYNVITITSPTFAFTGLRTAGTIITFVFLGNNTSATSTLDVAFAENSFTGISVTNTDTLVLTWTITMT